MSNKTIISIDAMGGSNSPDAIIEAVDRFFKSHDDVIFLLHGKKSVIMPKIINYIHCNQTDYSNTQNTNCPNHIFLL